jgi:hypothetical protein
LTNLEAKNKMNMELNKVGEIRQISQDTDQEDFSSEMSVADEDE